MSISFDGKVAIVTGAGNGLGRSHALELARRGAKVVVNDLGGARDGSGGSLSAAETVVQEIIAAGGEAIANGANVTDYLQVQEMVREAAERWGRVDILVNNAGILRDKSFAKAPMDDFKLVVDVHLMGSVNCTKAVWEIMREQHYGRIVMTTSSSGLYGNFGQSNYGAAKTGVVGFMNTLCLEGEKYGIKVNCLSPTAATRMTEDVIPDPKALELLTPESVTAGLIALVAEDAPNRFILCAGAGAYAKARILETEGIYLPPEQQTAENVLSNLDAIADERGQQELVGGLNQTVKFIQKAAQGMGVKLDG
ncbi:SDR family NAD(P)-dependent oxidoreductase [Microbulbifer sp. CAU 1566]|uniref:SDR family NAD(P)-dependent oxidoreductase n=1 Tax=Microbulbifer sp. CAU 1566 TaxID=2933269 RepID=UPI0020069634|nr:SDR family NAD(P)-dependent oxidoreductase [Microbulbifer sp. CAU 1566]MCK7597597.1 SDR family NAD(P)-dependent oxidoreductase [Microbulbifer sp. CAU 1566]